MYKLLQIAITMIFLCINILYNCKISRDRPFCLEVTRLAVAYNNIWAL